jgi:hypothetical protein
MFNTSSVKATGASSVKPGINVNVPVEAIFEPLRKDGSGDPVLCVRVVDTNIKKIMWEPKQTGNVQGRACPFNFEFNGVKGQKGVEMTDEVANALEMMGFIRDTKTVLTAVVGDITVEGKNYAEFSKNFVTAVGSEKTADVKLVYGKSGYLEFASKGYIAAPNSNKLTLTATDVIVKPEVNADADMVSVPAGSGELPF